MYGTMYVMHRTTLYFPEDLRLALTRFAEENGCTEAEIVRGAVRAYVVSKSAPRPKLPLFTSRKATLAEHVDEELNGFGEI